MNNYFNSTKLIFLKTKTRLVIHVCELLHIISLYDSNNKHKRLKLNLKYMYLEKKNSYKLNTRKRYA